LSRGGLTRISASFPPQARGSFRSKNSLFSPRKPGTSPDFGLVPACAGMTIDSLDWAFKGAFDPRTRLHFRLHVVGDENIVGVLIPRAAGVVGAEHCGGRFRFVVDAKRIIRFRQPLE